MIHVESPPRDVLRAAPGQGFTGHAHYEPLACPGCKQRFATGEACPYCNSKLVSASFVDLCDPEPWEITPQAEASAWLRLVVGVFLFGLALQAAVAIGLL